MKIPILSHPTPDSCILGAVAVPPGARYKHHGRGMVTALLLLPITLTNTEIYYHQPSPAQVPVVERSEQHISTVTEQQIELYNDLDGWFQAPVNQGNTSAQYLLGQSYKNGEGVEKDPELAVHWYRKAAENGNQDAKDALKRLGR